MYPREMPNSFFSRLLERVYVRGVHNSDYPLEKIIMLGMTLLTVEHGSDCGFCMTGPIELKIGLDTLCEQPRRRKKLDDHHRISEV